MPNLRPAALLFAGLLAVMPVAAANELATINAFEALLSLPQTQPEEGQWGHRAPPGFDSEDEADLIRWLAKQKKAGADFGALRHAGTMLHHAIRGGLDRTALWLLANGADPLLAGERDALELTVTYRRWSVFEALIKQPAVIAPERSAALGAAWRAALAPAKDDAVGRLLARRLPLPVGAEAKVLLDEALRQRNMKLVLALTAPPGTPPGAGEKSTPAADVETADARLPQPILPDLVAGVRSQAELDALWKLKLRRPFDDAVFCRRLVLAALSGPATPAVRRTLFDRLPAAALQGALADSKVLSGWLRWTTQLSGADADWAFAQLGELPRRQPEALLEAMIKDRGWYGNDGADSKPAAAWGRLLAALRAPLPAAVQGKLWMFVPPAHRARLLALAYQPSREELATWLERSNAQEIRQHWPPLKAARPELGASIHQSLLLPYSLDAGACNDAGIAAEVLDKAKLLLAGGAQPAAPVALDAGCLGETPPALLAALQQAGLIQPAPAREARRFVAEAAACQFRPSPAWRRALAGPRSLGENDRPPMGDSARPTIGEVPLDAIEPVALPGDSECALLVYGGSAGGRISFDEDGFTGPQHFSPCADGQYASALWRLEGDRLQVAMQGEDLPAIDGLQFLRDTKTGRQFMLVGGQPLGGCGTQTPPALLTIERPAGQPATLRVLPRQDPVMQAFLRQCKPSTFTECFAGPPVPAADAAPRSYPGSPGLGYFADRHWDAERRAFIDAVLAFDQEQLRNLKAAGIFGHWVTDAIRAVSAAKLPLEQKRRRTAWLFRDPVLLARALEREMLLGLIDWLPREDWGPLIKAGAGAKWQLDELRRAALKQDKLALACRFSVALQQPCRGKDDEDALR